MYNNLLPGHPSASVGFVFSLLPVSLSLSLSTSIYRVPIFHLLFNLILKRWKQNDNANRNWQSTDRPREDPNQSPLSVALSGLSRVSKPWGLPVFFLTTSLSPIPFCSQFSVWLTEWIEIFSASLMSQFNLPIFHLENSIPFVVVGEAVEVTLKTVTTLRLMSQFGYWQRSSANPWATVTDMCFAHNSEQPHTQNKRNTIVCRPNKSGTERRKEGVQEIYRTNEINRQNTLWHLSQHPFSPSLLFPPNTPQVIYLYFRLFAYHLSSLPFLKQSVCLPRAATFAETMKPKRKKFYKPMW